MLINKDQENAHKVRIALRNGATIESLSGPVSMTIFGSAQYHWNPTATGGSADPDGPAAHSAVNASPDTLYTLPEASITVIRGKASP
jgi:hypothetical protein